jgi:hypothetical protein
VSVQEVTHANVSVIKKTEFKQRLMVLRKSMLKSLKAAQNEYLRTVGVMLPCVVFFKFNNHISLGCEQD